MFVLYAVAFVVWIMLMDVGAEKSWETFNIIKLKEFIRLVFRCLISGAVTYVGLVLIFKFKGTFNPSGLYITPFAVCIYYFVHILFNSKYRESWKEFLKIDRWNLVSFLGCVVMGFSSTILS